MNKKEILKEVVEHIKSLYDLIIINPSSRGEVSFQRFSDDGIPFGLDYGAYRINYRNLFQFLFNIDSIGDYWSEDSIREMIDKSLTNLAFYKTNKKDVNFDQEAKDLLAKFDVEFEYQKCLIPIVGLSLEESLEIGDVKLLNIEEARKLDKDDGFSFFEKLSSHKNAVAICEIKAEWKLASQLASVKIEKVLNLLRFIGTLVWYDQPNRHIYIMGRDRSRFRYSLVIDSEGHTARAADTEFFILPYKIDTEFMQFAKIIGFDFYKKMIDSKTPSSLEKSLLVAIDWYGDATQDLNHFTSFIKFYISIESILKRPSESGKNVVPKRLSVILYQHNKQKQRKLKMDIENLIDERNSVIHSGETIKEFPQYLSYLGRTFSKQLIHQVRQIIEKEGLNSKDDLVNWVNKHYKKYLK